MANTTAGRRGSGSQLTLVWMGIAIVLVIGLVYWLAVNSEPSRVAAIVEEDTVAVADDGATVVSADVFAGNPDQYRGQNVELRDVVVAAPIGNHAFWLDLPRQPFLVRMSPALVSEGRNVQSGDRVTVAGVVVERSDSVLAAWQNEGVISSEGQRLEMEFATTFIEARRVVAGQPTAP